MSRVRSTLARRVGNPALPGGTFAVGLAAGLIVMPGVVRGGAAVAGAGHSACALQHVTARYVTEYSASVGGYALSAVTLERIPPGCVGQRVAVTVRSASGNVVATKSAW